MKKSFISKIFFTEKNIFTERNMNQKSHKIFEKHLWRRALKIYFYVLQKMFVLQTKYKSFLNIYSFCKKAFLIIKNIFAKTSL